MIYETFLHIKLSERKYDFVKVRTAVKIVRTVIMPEMQT